MHNPLTKYFSLFQFLSTRKVHTFNKDTFKAFQNMIHCIHFLSVQHTSYHYNPSDVSLFHQSCLHFSIQYFERICPTIWNVIIFNVNLLIPAKTKSHKTNRPTQVTRVKHRNISCWYNTFIKVICTLIPWHPDNNRMEFYVLLYLQLC